MPGIVGLITGMAREWAEPQLLRMVESLRHESFYVTGTWINEVLGVYVGWVARRHSFCDGMPLFNERGDVCLTFSGEEYPKPGTRCRLRERGHVIHGDGPDYLVHLCEEDPEFLSLLNGRFHGLLADLAQGTATLFNDRYGMHRIYYHESRDAVYFAAEAKAILAVHPELRSPDPRGLGEFVACGCTLENRTLYRDVHVLPPASVWVFRDRAVQRKGHYFHPREWEAQTPLTPQAYYQELSDAFTRNLPRYFSGAEPVGMSLTAGLDTRMIMAWCKCAPESLPCYSFGGMFRDCHDVVLARKVALACRQTHEVIQVGQEFLSRFPHYAERTVYLTDGCSDVSQAPDLYANERARGIAPVRMTGNYGGEVIRGVRLFKAETPTPEFFDAGFRQNIDSGRATYDELIQTRPLSFFLFRQAPWHHYGRLALEQSQLSLRSPYLDNDFVQTAFRAPRVAGIGTALCLRLIAEGNANLQRIRTDMGLLGDSSWLPSAIAQRLLAFTHKAEYGYDYGMPQWVARIDNLISPLHPERLFLGRHKFYHFRIWYRGALARYVQDMLLDERALSRPYLDRRSVESMVRGHVKGSRNFTSEIHKLLTLELLHRLLLDAR